MIVVNPILEGNAALVTQSGADQASGSHKEDETDEGKGRGMGRTKVRMLPLPR